MPHEPTLRIIAHDTLEMGARDLYCFLRDHVENRESDDVNWDPCIIDIVDRAGNPFNHIFLRQHADGRYELMITNIPAKTRSLWPW